MIAVLASGNGSNLQALIDSGLRDQISIVICNNPEARALKRAQDADIQTVLIDHRRFENREDFDHAILKALQDHDSKWVVLAGFMRIIGSRILDAFPQRAVNIHPALLPSFAGLHGQRQALESGARIAGCTVHLLDAGVDTGPILAQAAIGIKSDDTEASLSRRILGLEHTLYPAVIKALLAGNLCVCSRNGWRLAAGLELPENAPKDAIFSPV